MENNKKEVKSIENFTILAIKNNSAVCFGKIEFLDLSFSEQIYILSQAGWLYLIPLT